MSELLNSDLAGPFATIAFLLFIDLFLMISYFGAKQNSRRKGHPKKRHQYRRHHGVRHHNRPYYHVGRMGDFGYGDESELQRLDLMAILERTLFKNNLETDAKRYYWP